MRYNAGRIIYWVCFFLISQFDKDFKVLLMSLEILNMTHCKKHGP